MSKADEAAATDELSEPDDLVGVAADKSVAAGDKPVRSAAGVTDSTAGTGSPKSARIERAAYRWNTVSGMLSAFQSIIMLVVLTHVCSVYEAGVFTIAFATANLFQSLGKYGMRQFQASDRAEQYTFGDYFASRLVTTAAMIVAAVGYILLMAATRAYPADKTACMLVMCGFRVVGSLEDVFHGHYQQQGRLDLGAFVISMRLATTIALFCVFTLAFRSLLPALTLSTLYSALFFVGETIYIKRRHGLPRALGSISRRDVLSLLRACLPLCIAAFLLFYIGNAPKYEIDAVMDETAQAYYGYIAMPVFVVSLLAGFIYNPMITKLADLWQAQDIRTFVGRFARLAGVIIAITLACVAGAFVLGVPVLDILYNADLAPYRTELVVLVAGGGLLAIATLATLGITIIRFQVVLAPIYILDAVLAYVLSSVMVGNWGISGASWAYFTTMLLLSTLFVVMFMVGIKVQRPRFARNGNASAAHDGGAGAEDRKA